jgi:hypothetical protein
MPTVAFKGLRVELTFPISRYFEIFDAPRLCRQTTRVRSIARTLAFGTTFSPGGSNEGIEFFAHDQLQDRAHRALSQNPQVLGKNWRMELL